MLLVGLLFERGSDSVGGWFNTSSFFSVLAMPERSLADVVPAVIFNEPFGLRVTHAFVIEVLGYALSH